MNNSYMNKHVHNLKKSAGLSGNGSIRYEYIMTKDELYNSYLKRMADLDYPLKVEPKRDRYVMNKKHLEKSFEEATMKVFTTLEKEIDDFIENEVMRMIECETINLLNTVSYTDGQFISN